MSALVLNYVWKLKRDLLIYRGCSKDVSPFIFGFYYPYCKEMPPGLKHSEGHISHQNYYY